MIKSCKKNKLAIILASVTIVAVIFIVAFLMGTKTASKDLTNRELDQITAEDDTSGNNGISSSSMSELENETAAINAKKDEENQSSSSKEATERNYNFSYYFNSQDSNSNVFSGLLIYARDNKFQVEYNNNYDFGVFIESIKGIKNGDYGKYWQYYVNGTLGDVAADKKILKKNDEVEWRFEVVPF